MSCWRCAWLRLAAWQLLLLLLLLLVSKLSFRRQAAALVLFRLPTCSGGELIALFNCFIAFGLNSLSSGCSKSFILTHLLLGVCCCCCCCFALPAAGAQLSPSAWPTGSPAGRSTSSGRSERQRSSSWADCCCCCWFGCSSDMSELFMLEVAELEKGDESVSRDLQRFARVVLSAADLARRWHCRSSASASSSSSRSHLLPLDPKLARPPVLASLLTREAPIPSRDIPLASLRARSARASGRHPRRLLVPLASLRDSCFG